MKTQLKRFFGISVILFCIVTYQYAQHPQKVITYTTHSQYFFSIPLSENLKNLNDLDYNKMLSKEKEVQTEIIIEGDQFPTIIQTFLNQPEYATDYENAVYQSITNKTETVLFDHQQQVISSNPTATDDPVIQRLTDEEVRFLGFFNQSFALSPSEMVQNFRMMGLNCRYFANRSTVIAINNEVEISVNLLDFIYEIRYFSPQGFEWSKTNYYQKWGDYIIPKLEVNLYKDTLTNQIPFIKTEIIHYLNYLVTDQDGNYIVDYQNKEWTPNPEKGIQIQPFEEIMKRDFDIHVSPNPASDLVRIDIPFCMQDHFLIEIYNSVSQLVYSISGMEQTSMEIDVSAFKDGLYIIQCQNGTITSSAKLIKNSTDSPY